MGMECHMFNQVHCEKTIIKSSPVPQPLAQKAPLAASHRLTNPSPRDQLSSLDLLS